MTLVIDEVRIAEQFDRPSGERGRGQFIDASTAVIDIDRHPSVLPVSQLNGEVLLAAMHFVSDVRQTCRIQSGFRHGHGGQISMVKCPIDSCPLDVVQIVENDVVARPISHGQQRRVVEIVADGFFSSVGLDERFAPPSDDIETALRQRDAQQMFGTNENLVLRVETVGSERGMLMVPDTFQLNRGKIDRGERQDNLSTRWERWRRCSSSSSSGL